MILHFSHIGLTDGRTFMIPFGVVPDGVALVTVRPPLPSPGAQTVAHRGLAGPSATKQNTKPPRRVIRRYSAALGIWVSALYGAVPAASAAPPILVHAASEASLATSSTAAQPHSTSA